jgi:hypothetical protein
MPAPHVRFPSSPTQLIATINTYASDSYDRVPISISPNPVALPGRGERVFSPSIEGFRLSAPPKIFRSLSLVPQSSPTMAEFEDPRSPRLKPTAGVTKTYPRTPYPLMTPKSDLEMVIKGKQFPRTADETSETAEARRRRRSAHNRNKLGLILNRPIGSDFAPSPSPLSQSFVGAATSSLNRPKKPAPLALESNSTESDKLSNAFWNSVSIESADQPMVTALEYPESAVEYEEKIDIGIRSASQPPLMFAGADGILFSPGLPRRHARVKKLRESIQQVTSPTVKRSSFIPIARKEVTAPSPNDPFAAFPSFGAVLEQATMESPIQYPAAVVQKD